MEKDRYSEVWANIAKRRMEQKEERKPDVVKNAQEAIERGFLDDTIMFALWEAYIISKTMMKMVDRDEFHLARYTYLKPLFEMEEDE